MAIITSSEIKNAVFKHNYRGYNNDQVDSILDNCVETIDSLSKENAILQEKLRTLSAQVDDYKNREAMINDIMLRAQKMADDIIREAKQKSENILKVTQTTSDAKLNDVRGKVAIEEAKLEEAKRLSALFIDKMTSELSVIQNQLSSVKTRAKLDHAPAAAKAPAAAPAPVPTPVPVYQAPAEPAPVAETYHQTPAYQPPVQQPIYQAPVERRPADAPVYQPPIQQPIYQAPVEKKPADVPVFDKPAEPSYGISSDAQLFTFGASSSAPAQKSSASSVTADDIANRILGESQPSRVIPAPSQEKAVSWDDITGVRSAPPVAKQTHEAPSLKFGKEFDITLE